ncbi:JAB domain-containing protein [Peptococcus simiae]|uniref:JAB domain-containing protein n=1 Tax=Peptococcus simiae TaxID=1643805 RepID=A0ABW9H1E9_9FIRM
MKLQGLIKDFNDIEEKAFFKQGVVMEHAPVYEAEEEKVFVEPLNSYEKAALCIREFLKPERLTVEQFGVLFLNTKLKPVGYSIVSVGGLTQAIVEPSAVFQRAMLANVQNIIVFHNHPSGDTTPSQEDLGLTKRLAEGGEILGIRLRDHIIVSHEKYSKSIRTEYPNLFY